MYSTSVAYSSEIDQSTIRVLEKLSHLGLSIALDNAVAVAQKQEVCLSYSMSFETHSRLVDHGRLASGRECA